jgi:hypothetical protein
MPHSNSYDALHFSLTLHSPRQRGRYRAATRGLSMHLDDVEQAFDIGDLSSGGCNLRAPAELLAVGRSFDAALHIGKVSYLADLRLKVVRHIANGSVACVFQGLSRRQEITLDTLLLEIQKRELVTHAVRRRRKKHP